MIWWIVSILLILFFIYYHFFVITIVGDSMFPTRQDGEIYLGVKVYRKSKCRPNDVYVFRPPYDSDEQKYVIKRLVNYRGEGKDTRYFFVGDNRPNSYDSREYGFVPCKNVVARVTYIRLYRKKVR